MLLVTTETNTTTIKAEKNINSFTQTKYSMLHVYTKQVGSNEQWWLFMQM